MPPFSEHLLPTRTAADNDPRPAFPHGWQSIGFADEIRPGQIVSRHMLGRDLVLFRGMSGTLTVADAYCPHLGAHLGGGDIQGDCIRCPFHHWQFSADGRCASMPYGEHIPRHAQLQVWPVQEINGFVFIDFHPHEQRAQWQIPAHPAVDDAAYYFVDRRQHLFRAHPQDVSENGADFAHFVAVHGWDNVALRFVPDRHTYQVGYDTSAVDTGYGDKGAVGVDSLAAGPGYTYTHYTGELDWLMMSCFTAVDPGVLYLHQLYYARRDIARPRAMALIDAVDSEWRADIKIWEAKRYREKPALNNGDGPIAQFRRWYAQFYE
jgi:phenylpropionate dioxygenase-like ring-hydroxylating dioxygenase large terminal subunit